MAMNNFGGWMSAIMRDDSEALRGEILIGLDFSSKDSFGQSPIHWAANSGAEKCLALLLESGDDPMRMTSGGDFPLIIAAGRRRLECVKALAAYGPDVMGAMGSTPLMIATRLGDVDAVKELSFPRAIQMRDSDGKTALHMAAETDNKACLLALLAAGANPTARDSRGNTPLMMACSSMFTTAACVDVLAKLDIASSVNADGLSAFNLADKSGSSRGMAALLRHEQSPELSTSWFWKFAEEGRREMAEASMEGLVLNSRNALGQTPLMIAAAMRWQAIIEAVAEGSDKMATDHRGNNALMLLVSAHGKPPKALLEILDHPWATSTRNMEGSMAEDLAAAYWHVDEASALAARREQDELSSIAERPAASNITGAGMRL